MDEKTLIMWGIVGAVIVAFALSGGFAPPLAMMHNGYEVISVTPSPLPLSFSASNNTGVTSCLLSGTSGIYTGWVPAEWTGTGSLECVDEMGTVVDATTTDALNDMIPAGHPGGTAIACPTICTSGQITLRIPSAPPGECLSSGDCAGKPHLDCAGTWTWSCEGGECAGSCSTPPVPPIEPVLIYVAAAGVAAAFVAGGTKVMGVW